MADLFSQQPDQRLPLAARMRPRNLDEYLGQEHLLGPDRALRRALEEGQLHSMIFWGPPGVGKTTLARMLASLGDAHFKTLSAVTSGVKDIRQAVDEAQAVYQQSGRKTLLFVDEVHRFNKSQQDAFLPFVEEGTLIFCGATTENPSFELNNALLSRVRVYRLRSLETGDLLKLLQSALQDMERGLGQRAIQVSEQQLSQLAEVADGDARRALNLLEVAADLAEVSESQVTITDSVLAEVLQEGTRRFDKGGDLFYEQISALHKSVRGSAPDASLYWLVRMLDGGCDPLYIARRVIRMASEDIGNADPRALTMALDAAECYERLGSPEGELALAQAVVYLACAPKSNAVYTAYKAAISDVRSDPSYEVPMHLRNAPTRLMKDMEFGQDYRYAHDEPGAYAAGENYFPQEIADRRYYFPVEQGLESRIRDKLDHLRAQDKSSNNRRYK